MFFLNDSHRTNYLSLQVRYSAQRHRLDYLAAFYLLGMPSIFTFVRPKKYLFDWFYKFTDATTDTLPIVESISSAMPDEDRWVVEFAFALWSQHPVRFDDKFLQISPDKLRCVVQALRIRLGLESDGETLV